MHSSRIGKISTRKHLLSQVVNSLHQYHESVKRQSTHKRWTLRDIVDIHIKRDEIDEAKLFVEADGGFVIDYDDLQL